MPDEMPRGPKGSPYSGFYARQRMDYQPFVHVLEDRKFGLDFSDSFYNASEIIIENLAMDRGRPDIEGVAAVFLFRHYLELTLKRIILAGRRLLHQNKNADDKDVKEVAWIHKLADLWALVLSDAKPKIDAAVWDSFDIPFVEKCIAEFHDRDTKGFAFRYPKQGAERYEYDFRFFQLGMEHVYHVLENILALLIEQHGENQEWEEIQNSF